MGVTVILLQKFGSRGIREKKPSQFGRIIIPRVKEEENVLALMGLDFESS
jgi:hypothetical protein